MVTNQIALENDSVDICLNPRWPQAEYQNLFGLAESVSAELNLRSHVWVATSGSTSQSLSSIKLVALPKKAVLTSARAVNEHLQCTPQDIWAQVLPLFHVGGIGVQARAALSGAKLVQGLADFKWDAKYFYQKIQSERCTLTSLVPTQVYDLVQAQWHAPAHLRAIVVGGGGLSADLYQSARALGWNLLPSYGMTETCSQIATASLGSLRGFEYPEIRFLSHVQTRTNHEGFLQVKGDSLLTCYAQMQDGKARHWDPKLDGWFQAEDRVKLEHGGLQILGRAQDYVKIGGEAVVLTRLRDKLEYAILSVGSQYAKNFALVDLPSERLGHEIHLFFESPVAAEAVQRVQKVYNESVLPFERIRSLHSVEQIPRTELGKIRYAELKNTKEVL